MIHCYAYPIKNYGLTDAARVFRGVDPLRYSCDRTGAAGAGAVVPFDSVFPFSWTGLYRHVHSLYWGTNAKLSTKGPFCAAEGCVQAAQQWNRFCVAFLKTLPTPPASSCILDWTVPPSSNVLLVGDVHGGLHSLFRVLHRWAALRWLDLATGKLAPGTYLVFLGDMIDRGGYGLQCTLLVMALILLNPERVQWIRGNHEDDFQRNKYEFSFRHQLQLKHCVLPGTGNTWRRIFARLPVAIRLTLGPKRVWLAHGGLPLATDQVVRRTLLRQLGSPFIPVDRRMARQIMWNDLTTQAQTETPVRNSTDIHGLTREDVVTALRQWGCDFCVRGHQDNVAPFFVVQGTRMVDLSGDRDGEVATVPLAIQPHITPALTISTNTGFRRSLVHDSFVRVTL